MAKSKQPQAESLTLEQEVEVLRKRIMEIESQSAVMQEYIRRQTLAREAIELQNASLSVQLDALRREKAK